MRPTPLLKRLLAVLVTLIAVACGGVVSVDPDPSDGGTSSSTGDPGAAPGTPVAPDAAPAPSGAPVVDAAPQDSTTFCKSLTAVQCQATEQCQPVYAKLIVDGVITGDDQFVGCIRAELICGAAPYCTHDPANPSSCWHNLGTSCQPDGWLRNYYCDSPSCEGPCCMKP